MSDTPETDEVYSKPAHINSVARYYAMTDHARHLERLRNGARTALAKARTEIERLEDDNLSKEKLIAKLQHQLTKALESLTNPKESLLTGNTPK